MLVLLFLWNHSLESWKTAHNMESSRHMRQKESQNTLVGLAIPLKEHPEPHPPEQFCMVAKSIVCFSFAFTHLWVARVY